ncbi:MAG: chemotaxis protein CheW [Nitrospirae bacterium]|jgi:purine-binding chemotaxis protein CheW|nr:chemotaxis protein CheW [Nitrospirota bacterium]
MDIAKIRKKLKDSDTSDNKENKTEEQKDESTSEGEKTEIEQTGSSEKESQKTIKQVSLTDLKEELKTEGKKSAQEQKIDEDSSNEIIEILTFKLLNEDFAFRITQLKEILKYQRITAVPKVPDYVVGITSLRGKVIPVIDLRTKILSKKLPVNSKERIKILIINGPKGLIGAVVDNVSGVVRITKSEILPPPSHLDEEQIKFIEGVAVIDKRFISILNMMESITIRLN